MNVAIPPFPQYAFMAWCIFLPTSGLCYDFRLFNEIKLNTVKKITEALLDASKEFCIDMNADKIKSGHQNAEKNIKKR